MAGEVTNIPGSGLVSNVSSMHKTLRLNLKCQSQFTGFKETLRFIWKNFIFSDFSMTMTGCSCSYIPETTSRSNLRLSFEKYNRSHPKYVKRSIVLDSFFSNSLCFKNEFIRACTRNLSKIPHHLSLSPFLLYPELS